MASSELLQRDQRMLRIPSARAADGETIPAAGELQIIGSSGLLSRPYLGIFGSRKTPADLLLPACDLFRVLRAEGTAIAGGFQGEEQKLWLSISLRGAQPLLICPARSLDGFHVPFGWRAPIAEGRLAVVSELPARWSRSSSRSSAKRNQTLMRLSREIFIVSARPESRTFKVALAAFDEGKRVHCFDHRSNRELLLLGAVPVAPREPQLRR
jgi:predicted Rossmann fold nucleotide-binding protein DprA/Smf involved in DNA uptake